MFLTMLTDVVKLLVVNRIAVKPLGHPALLDTFSVFRCLDNFLPFASVPPGEKTEMGFTSFS